MMQYEQDFSQWAQDQARALADGRFADLDIPHLTEEVRDLGGSERRELENRLIVLLAHLLKWQAQPGQRSRSWFATINEQRRRIARLLADNPSLRKTVADVTRDAFDEARASAADETGIPLHQLLQCSPFSFEEAMEKGIEAP